MKFIKNQTGSAHFAALFVVVFAVIGAAILTVSNAQTPPKETSIKGSVTVTDPSTCNSKGKSCDNTPYASADGKAVREAKPGESVTSQSTPFKTNEKGKFKITLRPGSYTFYMVSPASPLAKCEPKAFVVTKSSSQDIDITCKTSKPVIPGPGSAINGSVVILPRDLEACTPSSVKPCAIPTLLSYTNASGTIRRYAEPGTAVTQEIYPFKTDEQGKFSKIIGPGNYIVAMDKTSTSPICSEQKVEVAANKVSAITIKCNYVTAQ